MNRLNILELLFIAFVFFGIGWKCHPECDGLGHTVMGDTNIIGYVQHDTTYIRTPVTKYVYVRHTVHNGQDSGLVNDLSDSIRVYSETYQDSGVTIQVYDSLFGKLIQQRARITSNLPLYLRVDTVFNYPNDGNYRRNQLFIGANLSTSGAFYPSLYFVSKRGSIFSGGYNPFNRSVMVGGGFLIRLRKR